MVQDTCKGITEVQRFDGKKHHYKAFVKLIEKEFKNTRVMEALEVGMELDKLAAIVEGKRLLATGGTTNIFLSYQATRDQVVAYCERIWSDTAFGAKTPRYYKNFKSNSTSTDELVKERNCTRLKHCMMDAKLWNSLAPPFR